MAALISLADAKLHLHVVGDDRDDDINIKLAQASAIVVSYLGTSADETWDETTVPAPVQAAIMIALGNLYENRGDDMKADDNFWAAMGRYLVRHRDPALA